VPRKDRFALTAKMKDIWHRNAIDYNDAVHVKRQNMDEILVQKSDVIDVMRCVM